MYYFPPFCKPIPTNYYIKRKVDGMRFFVHEWCKTPPPFGYMWLCLPAQKISVENLLKSA
jgi:hypothetical protein